MPFLLFFTLFALLDFVILFSVGSQIGLLTTLLMVLATGFIGLHLIRREGVATLARAQERFARGELLTGAALIFGGALLMAPGFVSDGLGLLCLIPDARRLLGKGLARLGLRFQAASMSAGGRGHSPADDWQQAGRDSGEHSARTTPEDGPLEGDFIPRGDARR